MDFMTSLMKGMETPLSDDAYPQLVDELQIAQTDCTIGLESEPSSGRPARTTSAQQVIVEQALTRTRSGRITGLKRMQDPVAVVSGDSKRARVEIPDVQPEPSTSAPAAAAPKKVKNPKRADRRRTIARFTTAILRAGGSNAFIARDGLGYRKAFDKFLVDTYGESFAPGGYWYENARVEPFFRTLVYLATEGGVDIPEEHVNDLFVKREKRQAAEWLLDTDALGTYNVTAHQLAAVFEGKPSVSPGGYPRGTPLAVPSEMKFMASAAPPSFPMGPPLAPTAPAASVNPFASYAPPLVGPPAAATIAQPQALIGSLLSSDSIGNFTRQYSSDLSRLLSEFTRNPDMTEEFLQNMQRTASELDAQVTTLLETTSSRPLTRQASMDLARQLSQASKIAGL